jgi:2-alkyl-3-oxoalkanoate reductase
MPATTVEARMLRVGGNIKSETDPIDPDPPRELRRTIDAIRYVEGAVTSSAEQGIALRYGAFYGPNTGMFDPSLIQQLRRRRMPLVGSGNGWWSFIHVEDAADATVAAWRRTGPASTTSWTTIPHPFVTGCRTRLLSKGM